MAGPPHVFDAPDACAERPPGSVGGECSIQPRQRNLRQAAQSTDSPPSVPVKHQARRADTPPVFDAPPPPQKGRPGLAGLKSRSPAGAATGDDRRRRSRCRGPVPGRPTRIRSLDTPIPGRRGGDPRSNGRPPVRTGRPVPACFHGAGVARRGAPRAARTILERREAMLPGRIRRRPASRDRRRAPGRLTLTRAGPARGRRRPSRPGFAGPKRAVSLDSGRGVPIDAGRMAVRPVGCAISISRNPD